MAETKTIMTDETGKDIADAINANTVVLEEVRAAIEALPTNSVENYSTTLSKNTPAKIKEAIGAGLYKVLWNVEDTIDITLKTGEVITVRIGGFDHDAENSIAFEMVDCLSTTYAHHTSNTNAGGWEDSDIRAWLNGEVFDLLPDEWQAVIAPVEKKASAGNQSTTIVTSTDKLYLLAMAEMYSESAIENSDWSTISNNAGVYNAEDTQTEHYKNVLGNTDPNDGGLSQLQKKINGTNANYWLRSPRVDDSTYFWYFGASGEYIYLNGASYSYGVSFGFCVKS